MLQTGSLDGSTNMPPPLPALPTIQIAQSNTAATNATFNTAASALQTTLDRFSPQATPLQPHLICRGRAPGPERTIKALLMSQRLLLRQRLLCSRVGTDATAAANTNMPATPPMVLRQATDITSNAISPAPGLQHASTLQPLRRRLRSRPHFKRRRVKAVTKL